MDYWIIPSDVHALDHCERQAWYDHNKPDGIDTSPKGMDALVVDLGLKHEASVYSQLEAKHGRIVTATSPAHTQELMAQKVPVIYQAQLEDPVARLKGIPDFLVLQPNGQYAVYDAKLSKSLNKNIKTQLAFYRRLLGNGAPAFAWLGNGRLGEVGSESDGLLNEYLAKIGVVLGQKSPPETTFSESKCSSCPYVGICKPDFEAKQELTLLAGVNAPQARALKQAGIMTISDLARRDPEALPVNIPYMKKPEDRLRAVLQARSYLTGDIYKLKEPEFPSGTWVHLDIETDPLSDPEHVYLWGFLKPDERGSGHSFDPVWADKPSDDKKTWQAFLRKVEGYRDNPAYPDVKFIHYSPFERVKIELYAQRYNMMGNETVKWLLDREKGPLVDLHAIVKDAFVLPVSSYGLKYICKDPRLVNFQWDDADSGSQWSVVRYHDYLNERNAGRKAGIKRELMTYNHDDVKATLALEHWARAQASTASPVPAKLPAFRP